MLDLCASLNDGRAALIQAKINSYLQAETRAETAFLAIITEQGEQMVIWVVGNNELEHEIRLAVSGHPLGPSASEKRVICSQSIAKGQLEELSPIVGHVPSEFLCVPISRETDGDVSLLACLVGKDGGFELRKDAGLVRECFKYTIGVLLNTLAFEEERRQKVESQSLLSVAKNLFRHLENVTLLLKEIISEARSLTKAERCSVFLVDKQRRELVAKVFDGIAAEEHGCDVSLCHDEIRIPMDQGVVGHVATTGKLLNIRDAYSHPLFYKGIDASTGFKTRNILCFPIMDDEGLIGVAELVNKVGGPCFERFDEEIATAFSIYSGLSIMHSLMFRKVRDAQYRSRLSNELMMYHMQVFQEEVQSLSGQPITPCLESYHGYLSFSFVPRSVPERETPQLVISMMVDLGFVDFGRTASPGSNIPQQFQMDLQTVSRFVLMVRKGYRDPPYHNWMHAFSVAHFCYLLIKNLGLVTGGYITNLEALALFVACLCHDLDHRGTTNAFQLASNSVLAALYSSEGSVMERHHFSQAMCILNTDGCNIFERFTEKAYTQCLDMLRDIILATDLAHHLRIMGDLRDLVTGGYDKKSTEHHNLLLCLLMTSCDISDQTKDWRSTRKIADLVYKEFFSQGDLEKAMGNSPNVMMDREKAFVPALQLQFLDDIVLPVFEVIAGLFPVTAAEPLEAVKRNHATWRRAQDVIRAKGNEIASSLDLLDDETVQLEVLGSDPGNT